MSTSIPAEFGRYRIIRLLGEGGMGSVYLAHDGSLGRDVALKIPLLGGPESEQLVERFFREARLAAKLHHPNICPVFDVGEVDGRPYLTMRYVEGRPLSDYIRPDRPQNPRQVALLVRKLAAALDEAHRHGVVHRDLKPANIMIDPKNEPVVMDFGLARQMGGANEKQVTQSGMIVGTPAYMSPEQISAQPEQIDARTDIWSMGVIFFEMLTGSLPYDGTVLQIIGAIQHIDPPAARDVRPGVPESLSALCGRMMTRDREQRFQTMADVAQELADWLRQPTTEENASSATADERLQTMAGTQPTAEASVGTRRTPTSRGTAPEGSPANPSRTTPASAAPLLFGATTDRTSPAPSNVPSAPAASEPFTSFLQDLPTTSPPPKRVARPTKKGAARLPPWTIPIGAGALSLTLLFTAWYTLSERSRPKPVESASAANGPKKTNGDDKGSTTKPPTGWHGWPADAPKPAIAPFDAARAKKHQEEWAAYLRQPVEYTNSIGMKFRLIPPGEYLRGSPDSDPDADPQEKPPHKVRITKAAYCGIHEVTQGAWKSVMATEPWKKGEAFMEGADYAAGNIPWDEAQEFCRTLGQREGRTYRLPTDAEWEHACRAGTATRFSFGDDESMLGDYGWYKSNALAAGKKAPVAVGLKKPNPFGLFDMHGNATEWCHDIYEATEYERHATRTLEDPQGPAANHNSRVHRGGGFHERAVWCRSARRRTLSFGNRSNGIGLRVLLELNAAVAPTPAIAPFDAAQAKKRQEEWAAYLKVPVEHTNSIGMKFRLIPPGEFLMGSAPDEIIKALDEVKDAGGGGAARAIRSEVPRHRVILTDPFYMGATEVTQHQYSTIIGSNPSSVAKTSPSQFAAAVRDVDTSSFPVETVSWHDARQYCIALSESERKASRNLDRSANVSSDYRLPTEAEWEFACRAGTTTNCWIGDDEASLQKCGWPNGALPHDVGLLPPNPFGLFDMHGNIAEWVHDSWEPNYYGQFVERPAVNPQGTTVEIQERLTRGGGWTGFTSSMRSSARLINRPFVRYYGYGFRVAMTIKGARRQGDP